MEKVVKAIQDEYPDDFAWCYGCGRLNQDGYHFRTGWLGEKTITLYTPKPEHTAIPGFVYGGLLASLIDCHGTGSASLALYRKNGCEIGDSAEPPRFVTGSLHVDFKRIFISVSSKENEKIDMFSSCRLRDDDFGIEMAPS